MMAKLFSMLVLIGALGAQSVIVQKGNVQHLAQPLGQGMYATQLDGQSYLLIPESMVDSLLQRIELLQAEQQRQQRIIAAKDSLLKAYQNVEERARQYIAVQQQLLHVADSLYVGYKQLYKDARALIGYGKYALWGQVSLARLGNPASWQALGSVGIGFQNWMVGYQFGTQFQGISVGIRWPVGW